jgi:3-oxoacyl-[acyl-carrier-protein] synthase-1
MPGLGPCPLDDPDGNPLSMGALPVLPATSLGIDRLLELTRFAFADLHTDALAHLSGARQRISVLVDEHLAAPDADGVVGAQVLSSALQSDTRAFVGNDCPIDVWAVGAGGGAPVLANLCQDLHSGARDVVLFGGVHSDCDVGRVAHLARAGRIFSSENKDGLLLGEGAAFVALCRSDVARQLGLTAHAELFAYAGGHEQATPYNDVSAFEARGLTVALRQVEAALQGQRIGWWLNDLNIEMYRQYEFQAVLARTQNLWCEPHVLDAPAQRMGELGAATLAMHTVLGVEAWRRGYGHFPWLVSTTGSEGGSRSAVALRSMHAMRGDP